MATATLLIPLVAPLQCWGLDSRFDHRHTAAEPSKSGVLGLLCAALGRDRAQPVADLAALRMGVRVDRPGVLVRDYHTALDVAAAAGGPLATVVSHRWYLADATFLCGLEGDAALLRVVHQALRAPRWPVFLGRKSCVPSVPLHLPGGLLPLPLEPALAAHPPLTAQAAAAQMHCVIEDPEGPQFRPDQPLGNFDNRHFGHRRVRTTFAPWNSPASS